MLASRRRSLSVLLVLLLPCAAGLSAGVLLAQNLPPKSPQVLRARTLVVPVDVRALDRNGRPVSDLKAGDFAVLENGVPQTIEYFSSHRLTADSPGPGIGLPGARPSDTPLAPQTRRIFLIVLGRGRLQEPSKGVDATVRFVRDRLLPQDQVAVMAWNRATAFSADHARTAQVVERFKTGHELVEAYLRDHFSGLAAQYAGPRIPAHIQALIDDVFGGPSPYMTREVVPGGSRASAEAQVATPGSALEAFRLFGGTDVLLADYMRDTTLRDTMDFDRYVALNRQTVQDVGNLYAGIDFLRRLDGEKHLVFVTEQGFLLPSADNDRDLATIAADARVAIHTIQTGGVAMELDANRLPVVRPNFNLSALRTISEASGGQVSVSRMAADAFDSILSATEFSYLLGYVSSQPAPDGRRRRIEVRVNRRDVKAVHRRAYIARREPESYDPRQVLANTRLMTAAAAFGDIKDLRFSAKVTDARVDSGRAVDVELTLATDRLVFARTGSGHLAAINFAIFLYGGAGAGDVGQRWGKVDVEVPAERMEGIRRDGITFTVRVNVRQRALRAKVVVYDYGSDLIGALNMQVR